MQQFSFLFFVFIVVIVKNKKRIVVLFARFPIGNYQKENGYKAHRVPFLLFSFRKTKKGKTSGATGVSQTTTARVTVGNTSAGDVIGDLPACLCDCMKLVQTIYSSEYECTVRVIAPLLYG